MEKVAPAAFALSRYFIPEFTFKNPEDKYNIYDVQFDPSGIYNPTNQEFQLTFTFVSVASSDEEGKDYKTVIRGICEAYFIFEERIKFEQIPHFFYTNSLAIVFPYIRSFISTLTLQSGLRIMMLPLLNLTSLSEKFKEQSISLLSENNEIEDQI